MGNLQSAAISGKLTQEQADAKLAYYTGLKDKAIKPAISKAEYYAGLEAKLARLVASGKLTQEQADAKLAAFDLPGTGREG